MNKQNIAALVGASLMLLAAVLGTAAIVTTADSYIEYNKRANSSPGAHSLVSFFGTSATTTTATSTNSSNGSGAINVSGAKKVSFFFGRGGATSPNTGSSKFEVEVSPNGVDWYDFSQLILQSTGTASSTVWITAATSTVVATVDPDHFGFEYARCQVVEVTDGEHTCEGYIEY